MLASCIIFLAGIQAKKQCYRDPKNGFDLPIGSMYGIYGNIYHQYTPMLAYMPYMDPMGIEHHPFMGFSMGFNSSHIGI